INDRVEVDIFGMMGEKLYGNQFVLKGESKLKFRVNNMFDSNEVYLMKVNFGFNKIVEKIVFA
ncbi:MAG: hypothetical protein KA327_02650, partial [Pseudarcicella sp.]|nr:hypothetical protein [Pseudarcicella sp.]